MTETTNTSECPCVLCGDVHLPPDPPAVEALIHREPCEHCGEDAFGYVGAHKHRGQRITHIADYHRDNCPLLVNGSYVIATVPSSQTALARELLEHDDWYGQP